MALALHVTISTPAGAVSRRTFLKGAGATIVTPKKFDWVLPKTESLSVADASMGNLMDTWNEYAGIGPHGPPLKGSAATEGMTLFKTLRRKWEHAESFTEEEYDWVDDHNEVDFGATASELADYHISTTKYFVAIEHELASAFLLPLDHVRSTIRFISHTHYLMNSVLSEESAFPNNLHVTQPFIDALLNKLYRFDPVIALEGLVYLASPYKEQILHGLWVHRFDHLNERPNVFRPSDEIPISYLRFEFSANPFLRRRFEELPADPNEAWPNFQEFYLRSISRVEKGISYLKAFPESVLKSQAMKDLDWVKAELHAEIAQFDYRYRKTRNWLVRTNLPNDVPMNGFSAVESALKLLRDQTIPDTAAIRKGLPAELLAELPQAQCMAALTDQSGTTRDRIDMDFQEPWHKEAVFINEDSAEEGLN